MHSSPPGRSACFACHCSTGSIASVTNPARDRWWPDGGNAKSSAQEPARKRGCHVRRARPFHRRRVAEERRRQQGRGRPQSGDREAAGAPAARQHCRSRPGAGIRQAGLRGLAGDLGLRPLQDHAQGCRPDARAPRRDLQNHGAGAGQALSRGARRGHRLGRHHRLVRRGRPPLLRPHRAGPRQGRPPACGAGADRRGRRLHAVEFPGADAGPQDRRRARGRLLAHPQGFGGDAGRLRRDGEVLRRRGPAEGRAQSRVRRAVGSLRASARQGRGAEDFVHRLDPGRQASRRSLPPRA